MRSAWIAAAVVAVGLLASPAARADDPNTVTVEGTSDVSDSHLMQDVITPGFKAAYPQYNLIYDAPSGGTGAALDKVRTGTGSGLLVHAQSLENQFVADGLSVEPYGRAVFWGDFVLLGPQSDPAGVLNGSTHNAVEAFKKIADAGVAGTAGGVGFVSRGNTSGTAVQEHLIWQLVNQTYGGVSGVTFCSWGSRGGGVAPGLTTADCPSPNQNPSWYITSGQSQGPNITTADSCSTIASHLCYTFTDRGTFQYLVSQGSIRNLQIVGRDNAADAPGGSALLVNTFHLYAINPNGTFNPGAHPSPNVPGALAFLDYVTSPAAQAAIGRYLRGSNDPPFIPDASPALTGTSVPASLTAGTPVTITGNLKNVVPGTPVLSNQTVTVSTPAATVASGPTDAAGNYRITFTPLASASYTVGTGKVTKIENDTLSPIFGDILSPQTTAIGSSTLQSRITVDKLTPDYRKATLTGTVLPGSAHKNASVTVLTRKQGSKGTFKVSGSAKVTGGTFSVTTSELKPGSYEFQTRFDDPGIVLPAVAPTKTAKVLGASSVKFSKVSVSGTSVKVTGKLSPAPATSGAYVRLLARRVGAKKFIAKGAKVKIAKGHTAFTVKVRVAHNSRWQFRLEYVHKNHIDTSESSSRRVTVH